MRATDVAVGSPPGLPPERPQLRVPGLLDFDGDEIYFQPAPELVGHTFREALLAYPTSTVIGRFTADGTVAVNPPMDSVFAGATR